MNGISTSIRLDAPAVAALEHYVAEHLPEIASGTLAKLRAYAELILRWNRLTSLVQCRTHLELIEAHIIDCLAVLPYIRGPRVLDVGSGAGLPGVVIALARPEFELILIEANQRRARFLQQAKIELQIPLLNVVNSRVESYRVEREVQCITARAYSSLAQLYRQTKHLRGGACLIAALKARLDPNEISALALAPSAISTQRLQVPGRDERHVVLIEC